MVEGRPDWVLSRQRAWGVPITLFVRPDGSYLQDPARQRPHRRRCARGRRRCVGRGAQGGISRRRAQPRRLRDGHRHSRRLVRFGLHPRLRARKRALAGPDMARQSLPRRLRPASRLVPVLAAAILRHARPRALRPSADPRLHDGRQGPQDVQERRQHHQPDQGDGGIRRRHHPPVGTERRFHRRSPHRR